MASLLFNPFSSTCTVLSQPAFKLFQCRKPLSIQCSTRDSSSPSLDFDANAFRHKLTRSESYNRKGFGRKKEALKLMDEEYSSKNYVTGYLD
ncbi:hypothetical protein Tco_1538934 [Tanacetum coccineum]